jgi:tetratricopeptide (TPR) repeat protein
MLDSLDSLLDKSMIFQIEARGERRFGMLETIREYALERLPAIDPADTTRRRHAEYYLALIERAKPALLGPSQAIWLDRLDQERDNLRAALQWAYERGETEIVVRIAAAAWRFWHVRGHLSEACRWLDAAIQLSNDTPSLARAQTLCGAGWTANIQGNAAQAASFFDESLALARALGDTRSIAMALSGLGRAVHVQGDDMRAVALYEEALTLFRALGDIKEIAWSLTRLGILALEQRDYQRATMLLEEGIACFQRVGFTWGVIWPLIALGNVALEQHDTPRATALYQSSLEHAQQLGDKSCMAMILRRQSPTAARALRCARMSV